MNRPYPLLLRPVVKDYLWGGKRLMEEYGFDSPADVAAEGWMLACHKDGTNVVLNGALAGKALDEALSLWSCEPKAFPLLIKLIDAADRLSVQVHPEDEYAYAHEGEAGKTEMWYVVDAAPEAKLVYGLTHAVSKEEFARRIEDNTLSDVLNFVPVHAGDVFFIKAGTIHAIGAGILIAEIQQNSNTTYRVSDYGRLGADGKPRALHIDKAMDVAELCPPALPYGAVGLREATEYGSRRHLADCPYFSADSVTLTGELRLTPEDFVSVLVLSGNVTAAWESERLSLKMGDSLFVPKSIRLTLAGNAELILSAPEKIF